MNHLQLPDGSSWPRPALESDEDPGPEWMLRYEPDRITRGEQLAASSIISAYGTLIELPLAESRRKLSMIRKALKDAEAGQ